MFMYLKVTFEQEFYDLMMYLKSKYPKKLFDIEGVGKQTDISSFSKEFFTNNNATSDVSVDGNSNVDDKSVIAYSTELPKPLFKYNSYYVLWKKLKQLYGTIKANSLVEKQLVGEIYINDFHGIGGGFSYCFNYSTLDVALNGLSMVKKIKSTPPKHFLAFKSQMEQFMVLASNSTLGATGIADYLITASIYLDKCLKTGKDANFKFHSKEDIFTYFKEFITSFVYMLNQPLRGNQSIFSNISLFDDYFLDNLIDSYKLIIDEEIYEAKKENIKILQRMFLEIMNTELKRTQITFPVTTACFSVDEERNIKDFEFLDLISEENLEFGFINIYSGKSSTLSSCCRLRSDMESIGYQNSIGGSGVKIGSLGVCTINLPRLAFVSKNEDVFLEKLEEYVIDCQSINNAKRHIVQKRIDNNNLPLYSLGFIDIRKQYSTVGLIGIYEALQILGYDIKDENGIDFAIKMMNVINEINKKMDKKYGTSHNVEQIPGEGTAVKLVKKDKLFKINENYEIYSNQFIPLVSEINLLDRIRIQGKLDSHFSGGSIAHINLSKQIDNVHIMKNLIINSAKQGVVYFAINYIINACANHHITAGNVVNCSLCGADIVDRFTRVVGFLTNIKDWDETRRLVDFPNRQFYNKV